MKVDSGELLALIYMEFGNLLLEFDCTADAGRFLAKSLKLADAAGDVHGTRRALQSLGKLLLRKGDNALAEEFFSRCLELGEEDNPAYDLLPLLGLVDTYRITGRYAEAEATARRLEERLPENPALEPYFLAAMSGILMDTGRYREAIEKIESAMGGEGVETRGEIWIELDARRAWCYFQCGETGRAVEILNTAIDMAQDKGSPYRESPARSFLSMVMAGEGRGGDAAGHAGLALQKAVAVNSDLCLSLALEAKGKAAASGGAGAAAMEYGKYSLAVAREAGHHRDMCVATLDMARSFLASGRAREAVTYAYRALHNAGPDMESLRKEAMLVIAAAHAEQGRAQDAAMLVEPVLKWSAATGAERLRREAEELKKKIAV